MNPDYRDRTFEEVEGDLRAGWSDDVSARHGRWEDVRHYARDAYDRGRERRLVLNERVVDAQRAVDADVRRERLATDSVDEPARPSDRDRARNAPDADTRRDLPTAGD